MAHMCAALLGAALCCMHAHPYCVVIDRLIGNVHIIFNLFKGRSLGSLQGHALAAENDGLADKEGLSWLADLGARGRCSQNAERDFHRRAKRELKIDIEPYDCLAPTRKADGSIVNDRFGVLLPHEVFAELGNKHGSAFVARMQGPSGLLAKYWDCHKDTVWMQEHPLRQEILSRPEHFVPIRIWGDDSGINKRQTRSIRVLTWSSATCKMTSLASKIAIFYIQAQRMTPETEHALMKVVAWSLNALITGLFPRANHLGQPLTGDRADKAGMPLVEACPNLRGVFCQAAGDWKYLKESWRLPQTWRKRAICRECKAEDAGPLNYADASPHAQRTNTTRTMPEYLQGVLDNGFEIPPLCTVIGYHISMMVDDGLHDDMLGVRAELVGGG